MTQEQIEDVTMTIMFLVAFAVLGGILSALAFVSADSINQDCMKLMTALLVLDFGVMLRFMNKLDIQLKEVKKDAAPYSID